MIKYASLVPFLCIFLPACGTILHQKQTLDPAIYGGVRTDLEHLGQVNDPISATFFLVDTPFSFIADTFLLFDDLLKKREKNNRCI